MKALPADGLDELAADARDAVAWQRRIERDRNRAGAVQPEEIWGVTETLLARSVEAGAQAVALTGSTARGRRTPTSDVDLCIVGTRPALVDFAVEVDVYATTADMLFARLQAGDDYVQWTLRFGCVLYDTGVLRSAAAELVAAARWPSPERKLGQARRMLVVAEHVVTSGDAEAAAEEVKRVLTAVARWRLLSAGAFPLSRAELSDQLRAIGEHDVAEALERCVHDAADADELRAFVALAGDALASATPARAA
jgi:Nucleotidyltransferase domain